MDWAKTFGILRGGTGNGIHGNDPFWDRTFEGAHLGTSFWGLLAAYPHIKVSILEMRLLLVQKLMSKLLEKIWH